MNSLETLWARNGASIFMYRSRVPEKNVFLKSSKMVDVTSVTGIPWTRLRLNRDSSSAPAKALSLKVFDLLPATQLTPEDAGYAALATGFVIDNWYAPSYIADKTFG